MSQVFFTWGEDEGGLALERFDCGLRGKTAMAVRGSGGVLVRLRVNENVDDHSQKWREFESIKRPIPLCIETRLEHTMRVLIFAAHPDDAEMTVGGSICRYVDAGHSVHVVNMTNNHTARVACAQEASKILGCTCEFLDLEDVAAKPKDQSAEHLGMQFNPSHLKIVMEKIREHQPDLIWAHWPVDTHPDHIAAGALVLRATDLIRLEGTWQPDLWFFPPAMGYQAICFRPDHFEDITPYLERKKDALMVYEKVISILQYYVIDETAHRYNGYLSGYMYAEAFIKCHFRVGRERYEVADSASTIGEE